MMDKEREEYLKLLAEHGLTEEEDEAMASLVYENYSMEGF